MPKATQSDTQPRKRKPGAGAPKKEITASVTLRVRVTPDQASRFKGAAKKNNKDFSKWIISLMENNS
jgi:hypothetical protein